MELEEDPWNGYNQVPLIMITLVTDTLAFLLGELLLRNLVKALLMREKHMAENKKFDNTFLDVLCDEWLVMIRNWEHDKSSPNLYTHREKGILICVLRFPACSCLPSQQPCRSPSDAR